MADDRVAIFGGRPVFGRAPAQGELLVGDGAGLTLVDVGISEAAGVVTFSKPIEVDGTIESTTGGFVFPDGSTQTTAATALPGLPLSVDNGGTGLSSLNSNSVIIGNGTGNVQFVGPGASGNVLTSDGTAWQSAALPANPIARVWKTSSQSRTSSTALTDDAQLSFSVAAGKTYSFAFNVIHSSGGGGSNFTINGPASPSSLFYGVTGFAGSSSYNTTGGSWNANFIVTFILMGTIAVGATGGTIVLRFSQTASSATSMTVHAGSWLEYAEVS
jgi:hypothetical protein